MNYIYSTILFEKKICLFCLVKWYIRLEYTIIIRFFIVLRQIFRDIPFHLTRNGIILRFESAVDIIYTLANEDRFDEKSVQIYHFGLLVKQNYIKNRPIFRQYTISKWYISKVDEKSKLLNIFNILNHSLT